MSQDASSERDADMLEEYDFSNGVRGEYAGRFAQGSNVVVLDPIEGLLVTRAINSRAKRLKTTIA
ncbi:MAG TPA: hypothetical protein VN956_07170 [Pyrinomonadaceae bacterium]|nr:hypothetical protein [Pyrinomonadaceae bacterium]